MVRAIDVTNVLGALEHPERKAGQEVSGGEQSSRGTQSESGALLQEIAHFLKLRYTMSLEDLLLLELLKHSLILDASVLRYQVHDRVEHAGPGLVLRLGVGNARNWIAVFVSERDLGDDLPAGSVLLVGETGMIHVEIGLVLGHQVVAIVELRRVSREPRVLDADGIVGEQSDAVQSGALTEIPDQLQQALPGHVDLHQNVELQTLLLRRSRLHVGHRTLEVLDRLQDPRQRTNSLA